MYSLINKLLIPTLSNSWITYCLPKHFSVHSSRKYLNRIKKETIDNNKIIQKLIRLGYTYDYIKRHIDV